MPLTGPCASFPTERDVCQIPRHGRSEMKHDASRSAGLILRGSVQLRAEIVHLNQAELHKGNKFDVEPGADGGGQGRIGSQAERATAGHNGTCGRKVILLRFFGYSDQSVSEW